MKEWGWLKDGMVHFETEEPVALFERDGKWTTGQAPWYIQAPEYSEELVAAYEAHVRQYNGQNLPAWMKDQGAKAIQEPQVSNMKATVVYAYPSGLYMDYSISSAYYFPKSGYLLVFTKQKRLAVGLDTMHGFLLLRRAE